MIIMLLSSAHLCSQAKIISTTITIDGSTKKCMVDIHNMGTLTKSISMKHTTCSHAYTQFRHKLFKFPKLNRDVKDHRVTGNQVYELICSMDLIHIKGKHAESLQWTIETGQPVTVRRVINHKRVYTYDMQYEDMIDIMKSVTFDSDVLLDMCKSK